MKTDILIRDASQVATCAGCDRPRRGKEMSYDIIMEDGWVAAAAGRIVGIGKGDIPREIEVDDYTLVIDASGKTVLPGFVDPHTHLVHAGSREMELALKLEGVPYLDILKKGGGILSTVRATREASEEELIKKATKSLDIMLLHGTTTIEAKSGYGLNLEDEIKSLKVAKALDQRHPIDIVSTFLGAHAVPTEYNDKQQEYIDFLIEEVMPRVKRMDLAEFCDIFCEKGVFSVEESRRILVRAREMGYKLKIHADEIEALGGAELAGELGTVSADHLLAISKKGIKKMKQGNVIAVLLPGTSFNLDLGKYARARDMIEAGLAVALATDYNPGSCPTENIQLIISLACLKMKMMPEEVVCAVTINAAHAIDRGGEIGSLEVGKKADIVVLDVPNIEYLPYHFGINHVDKVVKNGRLVVDGQRLVY
ncbi:MAG: imidazolonepropionase [Firmicutes bacterium]|nr:imidazolonepropionase [Bacillota bacterium]MDD3298372.1 imidazolonepropionase [Bacillota bacterium]MDD3851998.1 imidazolonepropionase [Bacillota bacterium]